MDNHTHTHGHSHDHIDIYCERTGPEFWSEPVNAITNAAFLIAAALAYFAARRSGEVKPATYTLITLIAAIGIGSFLFHTFAVTWAKFADVIPIILFQLLFIWVYTRDQISWGVGKTLILIGGFFGLSVLSGLMPYDWFNGSQGYAPALIFLIGFAIHQIKAQQRYELLIAACVFITSLTFRTIDMYVCEALPLGVHFLWHILNAVVLYLSVKSLMKS